MGIYSKTFNCTLRLALKHPLVSLVVVTAAVLGIIVLGPAALAGLAALQK